MAYDRVKIYEQAKEVITKHNLFFIEDIVAFIPCDKTTFYRFFPLDCNEYNELKDLLETNKIKTKSSIRAKLYKGEKAAELLALYKLICSDEERKALSMQHIENNVKIQKPLIIDWGDNDTTDTEAKASGTDSE
jgi:hypothetical protein